MAGCGTRHSLSSVTDTLEAAMQENPSHWKNYHHGNEAALRIARKYSYSDRSRYYWALKRCARRWKS